MKVNAIRDDDVWKDRATGDLFQEDTSVVDSCR